MKVINALDGKQVRIGEQFMFQGEVFTLGPTGEPQPTGEGPLYATLLQVRDYFLGAQVLIRPDDQEMAHWTYAPVQLRMSPFERIAVIPT